MKTFSCYKCKKRKLPEFFYKCKGRYGDIMSKCKDCCRERKNNPEFIKRKYKQRVDYFIKYQKNYYLKNPIKIKAREAVKEALKSGKIKKRVCKVCKSTNTRGHHPDYSKPLKVIWLCQTHHQQLHYKLKNK